MKDIASYCDEIIVQSKQNIRKTESNLKKETTKEVYFQIEETNEAKTKRLLKNKTPLQCQFKKLNSLKY